MLGIFQQLGPTELILILALVLLLFGAKKLPEMARSLGRSSKEFKEGLKEGGVEDEDAKPADKPAEAGPAGNGSSNGKS